MYTLEELRDKTFKELKALGYQLNALPDGDKRCRQNWIDAIAGVNPPLLALLEESAPADSDSSGAIEVQTSPGAIEVQTSPGAIEVQASPGAIDSRPTQKPQKYRFFLCLKNEGNTLWYDGKDFVCERWSAKIYCTRGIGSAKYQLQSRPEVRRAGNVLQVVEIFPSGTETNLVQEELTESKFGRIAYPRAGSKSIAQLPKTSPGVEDIQGQNHAEPNGIGTEQNGTHEIAIGSGIHQQCLNTAQPDGGNDGTQTQTPRSQKGDRVLETAGNGQAVERRPLPRESTELTALFNDDRPPNRGDNGRDRLESEPKLSQSAIELVAENLRSVDSQTLTAHQLLLEQLRSRRTSEDFPTLSDSFLARYLPPQSEKIHYLPDSDGQLGLFDFDVEVADEPPDPDDFDCMSAFWVAYDAWEARADECEQFSEYCAPLELPSMAVTNETIETVSGTSESSSTCEFLIPVFAESDRADNDEPPTAGAGVRRPLPKPPTFGPVMVVAGDRTNSINKFARRAIHLSGRAPPGGDAQT